MSSGEQERRKSPRAVFPCKIIVEFPNRVLTSHTENISKGGIKVLLEEQLEHLSLVGIEISLKKDAPIRCEGRVMWTRESVNPVEGQPTMFSTGIMFTSISNEDREYIKDLVEKILDLGGQSAE